MSKPRLVIIGTGWAGYTLQEKLDEKQFDITIISPEPTSPYTPLLASAACGLFDFSLAEEPVRRKNRTIAYHKARVEAVDFAAKKCSCRSACDALGGESRQFEVSYDILVLAPGCVTNTFNTPGAEEHAFFVRNVANAKAVQHRLQELLELASLPGTSEEEQKGLLHIVMVGGGPTGVEMAAEMSDLFNDDFAKLYPHLAGHMKITILDAAHSILGAFEESLREHCIESFSKRHVSVITDSKIEKVEKNSITTAAEGRVPCGMVIWTAGNKQNPLIDTLDVAKTDRLPRIMTDEYLRILDAKKEPMNDVYALGDVADVKNQYLPTTAEVAVQKAEYLAKQLNARGSTDDQAFGYAQKPLVAYIGGHDGIIAGQPNWTGPRAWAAWRSKNLLWTRSVRRRVQISTSWALDWLGGKEIARA